MVRNYWYTMVRNILMKRLFKSKLVQRIATIFEKVNQNDVLNNYLQVKKDVVKQLFKMKLKECWIRLA